MESAPLQSRLPRRSAPLARVRAIPLRRLEVACLAGLVLAAVALFAFYPAYPSYDAIYALVWGRELIGLDGPSFEAYRAPTQHPLAVGVSAVLSLLGEGADRLVVLISLLSLVALVAGVYRLGKAAFTPLVGFAAALVLLSRFDFASFAIRAFIDIPYLAALVWAVVLEAERPRRGRAVFVLLLLAGLMRPEAWALAGAYWLWRSRELRSLGWVAAAPAIWLGLDLVATGDPFHSFSATSETVATLGRSESVPELPGAAYEFLTELVKTPVLLGGLLGVALAVWLTPARAAMPLVLLAASLGTFAAIGAAGLAVIDRYLLLAATALCVFAGYAAAGFTTLRPGLALRRAWAGVAVVGVVVVVAFTLSTTLNVRNFGEELAFRTDSHDSLVELLESDAVERALDRGCAPVSTPTHKLVPEVRWILDAGEDEVVARSDPDRGRDGRWRGLAMVVRDRRALVLQGFDPNTTPRTQVPPRGFEPLAVSEDYAAYARC